MLFPLPATFDDLQWKRPLAVCQKQTCDTSIMLIHHDEVALAKAPPSLWDDYAAGKVN